MMPKKHHWVSYLHNSPSNAEAIFVQSTRVQRFSGNHLNPVKLVFVG